MTTTTVPAPAQSIVDSPATLGFGRIVALHLLPGLIVASATAVFGWLLRPFDLPSIMALLLAIPLTLLPAELGFLLYQGKRKHGVYTLRGVVTHNSLTAKQYAIWIPLTLIGSLALFILFGITDGILYETLFAWWPAWMEPSYYNLIGQSSPVFWGTIVMLMVFGNWVGPLVEELYFRGYLLPRMAHLGRWGAVLNGTLFAIYHFWSPWYIISRSFGMLPITLVTQQKRNIVIPIVVHCLLNTVGVLLFLGSIA